jgi:hypothetical protein
MRSRAWVAALTILAACSTTVALQDELARKERDQRGAKVVITTGRLPDGQPWNLYAYRKSGSVICIRHAWIQSDGGGSEGTCSPPEGPKITQSSITYPRVQGNENLRYYIGLVAEPRAVRVRWAFGSETQSLDIHRNRAFGDIGFTIARLVMSQPPETIELLETGGSILHSERFQD